ncbi:MAG: GNAT family N-acetyltransferase [Pseudomonas sp.]
MATDNPSDAQATMTQLRIDSLDNRDAELAAAINRLQLAAYRQEGDLLGIRDFPPLRENIRDVQLSSAAFFGAFMDEQLAGILCTEPRDGDIRITSLTVAPEHQRQGIARALVCHVARTFSCQRLYVSTSSRNVPGIALYRVLGFVAYQQRHAGPERVEITDFSIDRSQLLQPQTA